jgi:hypothetical protein
MGSRGEERNLVLKLFGNCTIDTSCNIILNETLQKNPVVIHCKFNVNSFEVLRYRSANNRINIKKTNVGIIRSTCFIKKGICSIILEIKIYICTRNVRQLKISSFIKRKITTYNCRKIGKTSLRKKAQHMQ